MREIAGRSDTSYEMSAREIQTSSLTRHLYETRMAFFLAILAVVAVVGFIGLRGKAQLACTAQSIATASARCNGAAPAPQDAAHQGIRVVFGTAP
ncbi:MAG: hypothetical protein ACRDJ1_03315 [Actinomycetota bacterium]